jgi:hypothetical protein
MGKLVSHEPHTDPVSSDHTNGENQHHSEHNDRPALHKASTQTDIVAAVILAGNRSTATALPADRVMETLW